MTSKIRSTIDAKEEAFVEHLLTGCHGAEAARRAGYGGLVAKAAWQIQRRPRVQQLIRDRLRELGVEANEVIRTLANQMRGDLTDLLQDDGTFNMDYARSTGLTPLIKKMRVKERVIRDTSGKDTNEIERTTELEIYSAQEAAKKLADILGLTKEAAKNPYDEAKKAIKALQAQYPDRTLEDLSVHVAGVFRVDRTRLINEMTH